MAKVKPNEAFEQAWDGSMRSAVAVEIDMNPQFAYLKGNKVGIASSVDGVKRLYAERKRIEKALFGYLRSGLGGEKELIDFLSGDAVATTPMLLTGDLRRLHLLDNGHSHKQKAVSAALARRLGVQPNVQLHDVTLSASTPPLTLPSVRMGVLADTGIALPAQNRMPQTPSGMDMQSPSTFRGAHVIGATVTLADVLRVFGGMSGRTLHVVETPFVRAPLSLNDWGDHLSGQLHEGSPWNLEKVAPLLEEMGTMRATFKTA